MNTARRPIPAHLIARAQRLGDGAVILVHEVHDHGHRAGWREGSEAMRSKAIEVCREAIALLEHAREVLTPAQVAIFVETYESMPPHPIVAAYFGSATDHLGRCVRRLLSARVPPPRR